MGIGKGSDTFTRVKRKVMTAAVANAQLAIQLGAAQVERTIGADEAGASRDPPADSLR